MMKDWMVLCLSDEIPIMAVKTSLIVGTILVLINHCDALLEGNHPPVWKILCTYIVPYCVSTFGAVSQKQFTQQYTSPAGDYFPIASKGDEQWN